MTWKTGDADEFLEDIMNEHVHEWQISAGWFNEPCAVYKAFCIAYEDCKAVLHPAEINRRLNATERLSAKVARRNGVILRLGADRVSYGKQTQGYGDSLDLMAYADILEGKDET